MISIRPFQNLDLKSCARIHHASRMESERRIIFDSDLVRYTISDVETQWGGWSQNSETDILVAELDGKIVGVSMFGRIKTRPDFDKGVVPRYGGEIYALYVDPQYFRKGIGRALFLKSCEGLATQKLTSVILWTLKKNKRACGFYDSFDGQKIGKKRVDMGQKSWAEESCYGWRDVRVLI